MPLTDAQRTIAQEVWREYVTNARMFINASKEYSPEQLDAERNRIIPELASQLHSFRDGTVSLEQFKSAVDGLNKRHRLWGFKGINGQMFFNMLFNVAEEARSLDELNRVLKQAISLPSDRASAETKIQSLVALAESLGKTVSDSRAAPRLGSIPYFVSYFWQVQDPQQWPIYYRSQLEALSDLGIWQPSGDGAADYSAFCELTRELQAIYSHAAGRGVSLWDVEHAFWWWQQRNAAALPGPVGRRAGGPLASGAVDMDSYVPPVVSQLARYARNDPGLEAEATRKGRSIEKLFEEKVGIVLGMLGYEVETLGQGKGRVPDGIALCTEHRYAIIYDAKARSGGYTVGTDDRAMRDYVSQHVGPLRAKGFRHVYFVIVSGGFPGDYDEVVRSLKLDTDVREVLFVEAEALLRMLEARLRNPTLGLGPAGLQRLLSTSGVLTSGDALEFVGS